MSRRVAQLKPGFTLVELLVVIGIITMLIAMLLPSLTKARRAATTATCASNLRQCFIASQLYSNDHKGVVPVWVRDKGGAINMWAYFLMLGFDTGDDVNNSAYTGKKYANNKAALCPETVGYQELMTWKDTDPALGVRSFAIFSADQSNSLQVFKNGFQQSKKIGPTFEFFYQRPALLKNPAEVIMFADSLRDPNAAPVTQCGAFRDQDYGPRNAGCIHTPHGQGIGTANVCFYDGHVANLTPKQLRKDTITKVKRIWNRQLKQTDLSLLYP